MATIVIADLYWYTGISREKGCTPRCPYATVDSCPRYYESLALLGSAGSTKIDEEEDARLLRKWEKSDLWPKTREQEASVTDSDKIFSNFCPEVSFERFGYFATFLSRYADSIDRDVAHKQIANEGGFLDKDWRMTWSHVQPQHFTECPKYSILSSRANSGPHSQSSIDVQRHQKPPKSEKLKTILEFLKYIRPKAYNSITRLIVIGGLGLISPPIITLLINLMTGRVVSFQIINENDPYFGISLIICALIFNVVASRIHISKRSILFALEYQDNNVYLANEGSGSVELFHVCLELHEIFEKPEFSRKKQLNIDIEKRLKPVERVSLFEIKNRLKAEFDEFNKMVQHNIPGLMATPFGLKLYVHYNIVGRRKRERIDFDRWVVKDPNGCYYVYRDSAYFDRNLSSSQKIKKGIVGVIKWVINPATQYGKYKLLKLAQKKLDFEATIRALNDQKLTEEEAKERILKLVGRETKTREAIKEYISYRGLDEVLTPSIREILD